MDIWNLRTQATFDDMKKYWIYLAFATGFAISACSENKTTVTEEAEVTMSQLEKEHMLEKETYADSVNAGLLEDTFKGSARREAKGNIGTSEITINYGSPGVRGRVIWNGLVSYDQVWVSGSHWATAVNFSEGVSVNGTGIPAGTYGFFTIPGRDSWTLIINKEYDMHLAEGYNETNDLVRIEVSPEILENPVQRLTYEISSSSEKTGMISLSWDKIKVSLPIEGK